MVDTPKKAANDALTSYPNAFEHRDMSARDFHCLLSEWVLKHHEVVLEALTTLRDNQGCAVVTVEDDVLAKSIRSALASYHCHNQQDDHGLLPLVDAVTPKGDKTITRGNEELELLTDHIFLELKSLGLRIIAPEKKET